MEYLYELTLCYDSNDGHTESFFIGFFETSVEAEAIAKRYLKEVTGFKDYDCYTRILELPLVGKENYVGKVYRFVGWNVSEDYDEEDIIYSSCFTLQEEATEVFLQTKAEVPREEWAFNCYVTGECCWTEGFVCDTFGRE